MIVEKMQKVLLLMAQMVAEARIARPEKYGNEPMVADIFSIITSSLAQLEALHEKNTEGGSEVPAGKGNNEGDPRVFTA